MNNTSLLGLAAIIATTLSWSLAPVFISRASSRKRLDPVVFNAARMLFAMLILVPLAYLAEGFPYKSPWLSPEFEAGVWIGGVFSTVVGDTLFVYSVSVVGASIALPVSYLFIIWSALYDYLTGSIGSRVLVAAGLAFLGVWLVARDSTSKDKRPGIVLRALLAAIGTSLVWAVSMYAYKLAMSVSGEYSVAAARSIATVLILLPYVVRIRELRGVLLDTFLSSFFGYFFGTITFLVALGLLPASIVGIGIALTPFVTQLLSIPLAREKPGLATIIGGLLLGVAIALTGTR